MRRQPQIHANSLQGLPIAVLSLFKGFADKRANIAPGALRSSGSPRRFAVRDDVAACGSPSHPTKPNWQLPNIFMARRSVLQRTRSGRRERALCASPVKNKCSTDPDFRQQTFPSGAIERSSGGDTPAPSAPRGCAAGGRRRGAGAAPTWRRRAADSVRRRSRVTAPGRITGSLALQNREIFSGEQEANRERTGENFSTPARSSILRFDSTPLTSSCAVNTGGVALTGYSTTNCSLAALARCNDGAAGGTG